MRQTLSIIAACLLILVGIRSIALGITLANMEKIENNKRMIQRTNQRMAKMFDELRGAEE